MSRRGIRSIRNRRGRKKLNQAFELQLTSMLDVMVIILVFLLKSYQTSQHNLSVIPGLQLPISSSNDEAKDSLQVFVTPEGITLDGKRIMEFPQSDALNNEHTRVQFNSEDVDEGGLRLLPLYNALTHARENSELLKAKSSLRDEEGKPLPFDGVLAITADKRIHYDTIRKIIYTAGSSGYKIFRFIAKKRDE